MAGLRTLALDNGLEIDRDLFEARFKGKLVQLTATEFDLLDVLGHESARVVPRLELLERVWGRRNTSPRVVDTFVSRLRTKLRSAGHPGITSIRKRGYRLCGVAVE